MMKEKPDLAEAALPDDQEAREKIVETERFVGVSPNNEIRSDMFTRVCVLGTASSN